jgi:hypothetical protein
MNYTLKKHGDSLEKEYADFISTYFNSYEVVWKLYIGNRGNNTRATIKGYPASREIKRENFSENTYTILQSVICLYRITQREVFKKSSAVETNDVLDLQDALISFFAHLGRIRDNAIQASECLLNINTNMPVEIFAEFYHKRHIVVHGKMLPIVFTQNGEVLIPSLGKDTTDRAGWNHKYDNWSNVVDYSIEIAGVTLENLFQNLMVKINKLFSEFKKKIKEELESHFALYFEYTEYAIAAAPVSGSTSFGAVSVYGLDKISPNKW